MADTGVFIALEGLDGSGTTTQAGLLAGWFRQEGALYGACVATCEPTAGPAGSIARMALNHRLALDSRTLALLFAADRADHVYKPDDGLQEPGIFHLLERGIHVVSDRYLLSSLAYQSLDLPMDWILQINGQALQPDITVFIDIDSQVSGRRLRAERHHQDLFEAADTQQRVQAQYEEAIALLQGQGHLIRRVDGSQAGDSVHRDILALVRPILDAKAKAAGASGG